jgi:hypothetical protein
MKNDLLIQCSRLELTSQQIIHVEKLLNSPIDWEDIMRKAASEGILPLLSRNLKKFQDRIPDKVKSQMRSAYLANFARNARLFHKLAPLLRAFHNLGLRAVLSRGVRLTETVYKDLGLRHFADVDLMVHPGDASRLVEILKQQGYWEKSFASQFRTDKIQELTWIIETGFHKDGLLLDFHFNFPGIEIPLDTDREIWDSIQTLDILTIPSKIFASEYELCLLCLHVQKHCYERLIWLTDIAELSTTAQIDWQKVVHICENLDISVQVYYGLYLVNMLWPQTISVEVLERFEPGALKKKILSVVWPSEKVVARQISTQQVGHASFIFLFGSLKNLGLKCKILLSIAFPPRGYVSFFYKIPKNSIKMYFYYLWRIFRPLPFLFRALFKI